MKEIPTSRYTAVGAALVFAGLASGIVATHMASDTASTTTLDQQTSAVHAAGAPELSGTIIAGQIVGKYHPLPWVGTKLRTATCPSGLQARVGASITCVGSSGSGAPIKIPVHVTAISGTNVTWTFDR
jgi:hypothetical protein